MHNSIILFWQPVSSLYFSLAVPLMAYRNWIFWCLEANVFDLVMSSLFLPFSLLVFSPTIMRFRCIMVLAASYSICRLIWQCLLLVWGRGSCFILLQYADCFLSYKMWLSWWLLLFWTYIWALCTLCLSICWGCSFCDFVLNTFLLLCIGD